MGEGTDSTERGRSMWARIKGKLAPTHVTTTANVGRAMIAVAAGGYSKRVLENADINGLAERPA